VGPNLLKTGSMMVVTNKMVFDAHRWNQQPSRATPSKMAAIRSTMKVSMLTCEQSCVPLHGTRTICRVKWVQCWCFPTKTVAERLQLPKQSQVGKSQSNKPAYQPFQHFCSHALMTTIVHTIHFYKAWMALITLELTFQILNELFGV
jgi:hypothetical protein